MKVTLLWRGLGVEDWRMGTVCRRRGVIIDSVAALLRLLMNMMMMMAGLAETGISGLGTSLGVVGIYYTTKFSIQIFIIIFEVRMNMENRIRNKIDWLNINLFVW